MSVTQLWLPILVSSVVVFIASSMAWMVLPHHKKDIKVIPDEKAWTDHLAQTQLAPGTYMWPGAATPEVMNSEEFKARNASGPWGCITVGPAQPNFGMNLMFVFLVYVAISTLVAYVTGQSHAAGAGFAAVLPAATVAAILGYCLGSLPGAIFTGKPARFVMTDFADAFVYAVLTGLIFSALWPAASKATT